MNDESLEQPSPLVNVPSTASDGTADAHRGPGYPLAIGDDKEGGWTLDPKFLDRIACQVRTEDEQPSMESVEAILLAACPTPTHPDLRGALEELVLAYTTNTNPNNSDEVFPDWARVNAAFEQAQAALAVVEEKANVL